MPEHSTYTLKNFIEREKEINSFEQLLDEKEKSKWILNVYGPGGMGKTQLLFRFINALKERRKNGRKILVTDELIDLYWTAHQRELGILKSIARQLDAEQFVSFNEAMVRYENLLTEKANPSLLHEQASKARNLFFDDYKNLRADQIILLFDTAEVAGESIEYFWKQILPLFKEAQENTLVVVAGRQSLKENLPSDVVEPLLVTGFSSQQVKNYFGQLKIDLSSDVTDRIAELSQGCPIKWTPQSTQKLA
ncbi:MAG: ATP-binding protein [Candidatus Electrothrix communis]|nr:MAG: ATP-binding protein [Candidatus Electrothrix communis]